MILTRQANFGWSTELVQKRNFVVSKEAIHEFCEMLELHSIEVQPYWFIVNPGATIIVHSFDSRLYKLDNRDTDKLPPDDQGYNNRWVGKLHASVDRLDRSSGTLEDTDDTK